MNKKGGEKILSIWWFLVLAIIGAGIVLGVLINTSANVDVRQTEAEILVNKIFGCININGYLDDALLKEEFSVLKKCGLSKEAFSPNGPFYIRISIYDSNNNLLNKEYWEGARTFEQDCSISENVKTESFPKCSLEKRKTFYYKNNKFHEGYLEILGGSNQFGMASSLP